MRLFVMLLSLVAIATFLMPAAPVQAQPVALTGKMAPFSYLLGTPWNCSTNVPAMMGQPAHTDRGTAGFEVAPGNVVHNHVSTPMYSGDFYFGYNDKMSMYWQASADNMGGHGFSTSSDGKTYNGTTSMGPTAAQDVVTYNKVSDNNVTVHDVVTVGSQSTTFDTTCTR
jgi:hypothetical protein